MVNTKWIDAHLGLILRASRSRSQSLPPQHVCWARLGARNAFKMWIDAHIGVSLMVVTFRRWRLKMKGALSRSGSLVKNIDSKLTPPAFLCGVGMRSPLG